MIQSADELIFLDRLLAHSLASSTGSSNKLFFILFARLDGFFPVQTIGSFCFVCFPLCMQATTKHFFFFFSFKSEVVIYLSFSFLCFFPLRSHFQFNFFSLSLFHNSFYVYLIYFLFYDFLFLFFSFHICICSIGGFDWK